MVSRSFQYASLALLALIVVCGQASAHSPSDMNLIWDPDSISVLVTITHHVSDLSSHYISEIELWKNGEIVETLRYSSQPSPDSFTYRYHLPLDAGDTATVIARCNIGGEITREYRNSGKTGSDI
jgi:desulfoferrodoxin (superoxide reductase-like protein)